MIRSVFLLSIFGFCLSSGKIVHIDSGKISGDVRKSFIAYRGIPYAEAPVGALRFAAPRRFEGKWSDVREFTKFGAVCAQYSHLSYDFEGEEDCLFLNVYVPKSVAESDEKVPVIFYIHGGAFMLGGGEFYGPENIMSKQNMILVTINYRLGVLGFLSTEDEVISGNFGLKDQVEALKWVQRNIEAFNGDPKRVTITGFSAGGASVHLHYMSPLSNGLFNNGISHSGNALDPWVMTEHAESKAKSLAVSVNCPDKDHKKLLNCLRTKTAKELATFAKTCQPFLFNPYSPFAVVVEPKSETAFLTDHPKNLLEKGNFKNLPWMLSQTQNEGLYPASEFYNDEYLKTINEKWVELAPFLLDFNGTSTNENRKSQMSRKIRKFYLGNSPISKDTFRTFEGVRKIARK
jgi:carboxylesterase type B